MISGMRQRWQGDYGLRKSLCSVGLLLAIALSGNPSAAFGACANEDLRTGSSANLPDCRAYELVTPSDANGRILRDPFIFGEGPFDSFPVDVVSPFRDSFIFQTSYSAFKEPPGGASRIGGDYWQTERSSSGWKVVRLVSPTADQGTYVWPGGFSSDHQYGFTFVPLNIKGFPNNGTLAEGGDADFLGDPDGGFELTGVGSLGTERLVQGRYISPGGEHVLFSTGKKPAESGWCDYALLVTKSKKCPVAKLEPEAPPAGTGAIYDRPADGGPTRVVSLLPGDVRPAAGESALYQGTAADGSSVAFTIGGTLYVRANNGAPDAETQEVASGPTTFGGISADGTFLFYVSGGNIHRFDTDSGVDEEVNSSGDAEMVNVSSDGSHVYFVSRSQLDGANGTAGEPNLYVWADSTPEYVTTVDESDTSGGVALTNWTSQAVATPGNGNNPGPGSASSRTTPDGNVIVFESRARLLPAYDNASHKEIYRFDAMDEGLKCVSCNPSGAPAVADARLENNSSLVPTSIIHNVTDEGDKVFFESDEALVEGDVDTVSDIYEWHEKESGPVVALISSGDSTDFPQVPSGPDAPTPNLLMGVSPDGRDVFFRALEPLIPGAPEGGALSIYDAREGGGFPPPSPPNPCLDIAGCRPGGTTAPSLDSPRSTSPSGSGNVKPRRHHRCTRRKGHRQPSSKQRSCPRKKQRGSK
jgi:hypothetical protein